MLGFSFLDGARFPRRSASRRCFRSCKTWSNSRQGAFDERSKLTGRSPWARGHRCLLRRLARRQLRWRRAELNTTGNVNTIAFPDLWQDLCADPGTGYDPLAFAVTIVWYTTSTRQIFDADVMISDVEATDGIAGGRYENCPLCVTSTQHCETTAPGDRIACDDPAGVPSSGGGGCSAARTPSDAPWRALLAALTGLIVLRRRSG